MRGKAARILANARFGAVPAAARAAAAILLASTAGACAAPRPAGIPADGSLVVALEAAPIHLDPRVATDQASSRVFELMSSGLVTKSPAGEFVPDLAEAWEYLDDGRRWRFHLRAGVRFHDGRPVEAADVAWTFGSLADGTVASAKRGALAALERVEAVDPRTVDFHLREPNGALLANLTSYLGIVPRGSTPDQMNRAPVGSGPFRFVARTADAVELAPFDGYWRGRPGLARVVLREVPDATVRVLELRKGSVQLVVNGVPPDVVPLFRGDPAFRVVEATGSNYAYLGLNLRDPRLADVRVRRALALSIDRPRLVATLWRGLGVPTETMLPPGHWARNDALPSLPHDPAAARRLLDVAGYPDPDGPDGPLPRFTLTYKTSTDETALLQAQIVQAMAREAGLGIEIRSYEFATFYDDVKRGNFQIFSLTWTGVADPDLYTQILHSQRVPPAGSNRGRYSNPEFDALIEAGARFPDPGRRRPFYVAAQEILARDLPYISLFTKVNVAVMPAGLEGYESYPSGELLALAGMRWRGGSGPGGR
jgi:peptide/nickel transport system substrate-binding protein